MSKFYRPGALDRLRFVLDNEGAVKAVELTSSRGSFSLMARTNLPLSALPIKMQLSSRALQAMAGDHELRPDLILRLRP